MKIVRSILFAINILLAVALLGTTVAGSFAPSRFLLPSLLAYGYLPLLAANVLMAILWLIMGKLQFLLSVGAIALRWSMVGLFFQVGGNAKTPDPAEHPSMVTVMSYNVRLFQGVDGQGTATDSNARVFLGIVREQQPDVLCLQEFAAVKGVSTVDSLVLMGYNHYYGTNTATGGIPYGTVVFSRLPITFVSCIDNEKLMVELMKDQHTMRVCNIHMDSYRFDEKDLQELERLRRGEMQGSESRTMEKVRETILSHEIEWNRRIKPVVSECKVPLLLAGDFNDVPNSWLYKQVDGLLDDTYRDCGTGFCSTYNGDYLKVRIDWVFRSSHFRTLSFRRINANISDHHPIVTSVEFAE